MKTTNHTQRLPRFDRQWEDAISRLADLHDRELLTEAIRRYQLDGTEPDLPAELAVAFEFLRPTIDRRARNRARRQAKAAQTSPAPEKPVTRPAVTAPVPAAQVIPGEDRWEQRVEYWQNFIKSRTSPLTAKEIESGQLAFESELWEGEPEDVIPTGADGLPLPYQSLLQHYCRVIESDSALLTRVADEVVRFTKMMFHSNDLRAHIEAFKYQSTVYPVADMNRATCRRAFIRYMINCAKSYRKG